MVRSALILSVILAGTAWAATDNWDYRGKNGPSHWSDLDTEFKQCATGHLQSPVNIRHAMKHHGDQLDFHYRASSAEIFNNGHTVQVIPSGEDMLSVGHHTYKLAQLHFHTPGEERFNGKTYPLDIHLVHKSMEGEVTVIAVPVTVGKENPVLRAVFDSMPTKAGERVPLTSFDPTSLVPESKDSYRLVGSLTTPPCTEGVHWIILKQPIQISPHQLAEFHHIYKADARPVQPLNGREVEEVE